MKITTTEYEIMIETPYNAAIIQKLKSLPDGRRWDPDIKSWLIDKTPGNIEKLKSYGFDIPETITVKNGVRKEVKPINYNGAYWEKLINPKNVTPFFHQKLGASVLGENNFAALFWEQGVGKTLPSIMVIRDILTRPEQRSLIVCPKGVIGSWIRQFGEFSDIAPVVITGTAKKRKALLSGPGAYIVNYDLIHNMKSGLQAFCFDFILFDESQRVMNPQSNRARAAYEIARHIKRRYLLTGTPIGNGSVTIFQQYKIMDPSVFGLSYYAFRNEYFDNKGWSFLDAKTGKKREVQDWKIKPGAIEKMREKISLRAYRLTKKEALPHLPPKSFQVIEVDLTPEQKSAYIQALNEAKMYINNTEFNTAQQIVKMGKCNQICSGHVGSGESAQPIKHNKLKELRRIFDDAGKQKIIVWTPYTYDILSILREFKNDGVVSIYGGNTAEENEENKRRFQNDESVKVIAVNLKSGGEGITLTASCLAVFYSRDYNSLQYRQAIDRNHRIGQDKPVTYINLICAGTIEENIIEALRKYERLSADLLGDDSPEESVFNHVVKGIK